MSKVKQAHLEKLAESWWEKTKRHYGYAMPTWLGGDKRPDFSNTRKFKPTYKAPKSREDMLAQLKEERSKTLVGHSSKPGSISSSSAAAAASESSSAASAAPVVVTPPAVVVKKGEPSSTSQYLEPSSQYLEPP